MTPTDKEQNQANFQKYYESLNQEQREAVDTIEGPVMAIAGAGTGKTQMLAVRIARILLETQLNPYNILCLTFTESGVSAMRKRLIEIIGPTAYSIRVCTFHTFCNEVIREHPDKFIFSKNFQQIDDLEKIEVLTEIIDENGSKNLLRPINDPYFYLKDIEAAIKNLKQENFNPENFKKIIFHLERFFENYYRAIKKLITIKGSPKEEDLTEFQREILSLQEKRSDQNNETNEQKDKYKIEENYLKFIDQSWKEYEKSLTDSKRVNSTLRTKFKNGLKDFFQKAEKDLPKQKELAKIYEAYQKKLQEKGRYDYEDMIIYATQAFEKDRELLMQYQEKYQYILVDEYQDSNSAQNLAINLLGEFFENPNIFVVGDDDQSIYRFQGASIENIMEFYKKYQKDIKIITLKNNYRSHQGILDAAQSVIQNSTSRIANFIPNIQKKLIAQTQEPINKIQLFEYENEQSENYGTAKSIQGLIANGTPPSEIAVLYRNHSNALDLIDIMTRLQIPFIVKAGNDILKDRQIQKLLGLLKAIENPHQDDLLITCLFYDFLNIPKIDILKLSHFFAANRFIYGKESLFNLISDETLIKKAKLSKPDKFFHLAEKIANFHSSSSNLVLTEYFEKVITESCFLEYITQSPQKIELLNKLSTLFREIKQFNRKNHNATMKDFLKTIDLRLEHNLPIVEETLQTAKEAVQLMTAHGSKGLEFEHVYMIRCRDKVWGNALKNHRLKLPQGIIKNYLHLGQEEKEEDERRLFYVALTRAKKQLSLSYAKNRLESNKTKEDAPSLFLKEISPELIEKQDTSALENEALLQLQTFFLTPPPTDYSDLERSFLKQIIQEHIISPTSLNNYLTCPRKFFYQNLIKLPQAKNKSSALGSAIHYSLDDYFKKYRKTLIKLPKDFALLRFQYHLQREILTESDYKIQLEHGKQIINDYFDYYENTFQADTITEYNFRSHSVHLEGIKITGKIDKIERLNEVDNTAKVTDFKTGNPDRKNEEIKENGDYWRQMVFYKLLCDLSPQFPYKMISGEIDFLEKSKRSGSYLKATITINEEAKNLVTQQIKMVHQQIQSLEFEKIEQSETCGKCPFHNICWKTE